MDVYVYEVELAFIVIDKTRLFFGSLSSSDLPGNVLDIECIRLMSHNITLILIKPTVSIFTWYLPCFWMLMYSYYLEVKLILKWYLVGVKRACLYEASQLHKMSI